MSVRFVIPVAGSMKTVEVSACSTYLAFSINKGYFEADTLDDLNSVLEFCEESSNITKIAKTSLITVKGKDKFYRQRIYFKSLEEVFLYCRDNNIVVSLAESFCVNINSVMSCIENLKVLRKYSTLVGVTIDEWLTNCCIFQLKYFAYVVGVTLESDWFIPEHILYKRKGYMNRSPYLLQNTKNVIMIDTDNEAIFTETGILGYTSENVRKDRKRGVLSK